MVPEQDCFFKWDSTLKSAHLISCIDRCIFRYEWIIPALSNINDRSFGSFRTSNECKYQLKSCKRDLKRKHFLVNTRPDDGRSVSMGVSMIWGTVDGAMVYLFATGGYDATPVCSDRYGIHFSYFKYIHKPADRKWASFIFLHLKYLFKSQALYPKTHTKIVEAGSKKVWETTI